VSTADGGSTGSRATRTDSPSIHRIISLSLAQGSTSEPLENILLSSYLSLSNPISLSPPCLAQGSTNAPLQSVYGRRRLDWFSRHANGFATELRTNALVRRLAGPPPDKKDQQLTHTHRQRTTPLMMICLPSRDLPTNNSPTHTPTENNTPYDDMFTLERHLPTPGQCGGSPVRPLMKICLPPKDLALTRYCFT